MADTLPARHQNDRLQTWQWKVLLCLTLALMAAALRVGPLGPWSLWRDDAWQALVVRADSWATIARIGQTAPGFSVLLCVWLKLFGFSSVTAQAIPLLAGVAGAPITYLVARRCGFGVAGAAAAGILIAISPTHATFSTRVKPFTLEADVSMLLLLLGVRGLEEPAHPRRWLALLFVGALGTVFSATALPVTLATALAMAGAGLSRRPSKPWLITGGLAALGLFSLLWWACWLASAVNEHLREIWIDYYIPLDGGIARAAKVAWFGTEGFLRGLSPLPISLAGALSGVGILVLFYRAPWLATLCVGPVAIAVAMAAMHLAPYGTGRTDIYLYPSVALLFAAPIDALARALPPRAGWMGLALAAAQLPAAQRTLGYPAEDVRSIVGVIESEATKQDAVFVYPQDGYIYALYSRFPISFLKSDLSMTGFTVAVEHPELTTLILAPHADRRSLKQYTLGLRENSITIRALFTDRRPPSRVWLVARSDGNAVPVLKSILREEGLKPIRAWRYRGVDLTLWTRGATQSLF